MANEYNDNLIWSLNTNNKLSQSHSRLPYGEDKTTEHFLGLNGERIDPITGVYHLGNGYRAYNPCLMRFHCLIVCSLWQWGINARIKIAHLSVQN
ncbi:hypothetical protein GQR86_11685 [Providencia vermicola]|nr:hypothetical protein [Providencia sp. G1(2023)]MBC8653664.1 hypothetical protein [Providencia vermicola]